MSYINFSLTRTFDGGGIAQVLPHSETISAGFSREGGKLEFVTSSSSSDPLAAPHTSEVALTPGVARAASGVLEAIQAAQWVQDVAIQQGDGAQPDLVSWTHRDGSTGNGLSGTLPAPVQRVLDAASLLEQAAFAPVDA
jgi:hypothetical protein